MKRSQIILLSILPLFLGGVALRAEIPSAYQDPPDAATPGDESVYDKMQTVEPLEKAPAEPALAGVNPADVKKQYDDSVALLNKATDVAEAQLEKDPKIMSLQSAADDAKNKYDDEIDEALGVMGDFDEYKDLITVADHASQQLDFIQKNSPNDQQSIATAQRRFADARKQVEDFEDGTLDQDQYVQQARKTFLTARDARDQAVSNALASDPAIKQARAVVDQQKAAMNTVAANQAANQPPRAVQSRQATSAAPQSTSQSAPSAVAVAPSASDQALNGPGADQSSPVYDNGDFGGASDSSAQIYPQPPDDYAPGVVYAEPPYYGDGYVGGYVGGYVDVRSRYHRYRDIDRRWNHDDRWSRDHAGDWDRQHRADRGATVRGSADQQRLTQREYDTRAEAIQNQRRAQAEHDAAVQGGQNRDNSPRDAQADNHSTHERGQRDAQAESQARTNAQAQAQAEAQARADAQDHADRQARVQARQAQSDAAAQSQSQQQQGRGRQQSQPQPQPQQHSQSDSGRHTNGPTVSSHSQSHNNSNDGDGRSHQ